MRLVGRVHWVIHLIDKDFYNAYRLKYDYVTHNYCFYRNYRYNLLDCFLIVRTSRKCFRVIYFNSLHNVFEYRSFKYAKLLVNYMLRIYSIYK